MGTPFKMKGSPMARNFGISAESPVKSGGLVRTAVKAGKKLYNAAKNAYNSAKGTTKVEPTYFNKSTGRFQSTKPKPNTNTKSTKPTNNYSGPRKTKNTILPSEKRVPWDPTKRQILRHGE
jgi:hypothetical protein